VGELNHGKARSLLSASGGPGAPVWPKARTWSFLSQLKKGAFKSRAGATSFPGMGPKRSRQAARAVLRVRRAAMHPLGFCQRVCIPRNATEGWRAPSPKDLGRGRWLSVDRATPSWFREHRGAGALVSG